MNTETTPVPFSFLCSLFREISQIRARSNAARVSAGDKRSASKSQSIGAVFKRWVDALRATFGPLPPGTTGACFRLIFPEEDHKRKFDMQETKLVGALAKCYGVDKSKFARWDSADGSGCLGHELKCVLQEANSNDEDYITPLSVAQVDTLLNELASLGRYTDASIKSKPPTHRKRTRIEIIGELYRGTRPDDAGFLTQIILKDLRPLIYPLPEDTHFSAILLNFNTKAVQMLTKWDAMQVWDPSMTMNNACRVYSDLDRAAEIFETPVEQRPNLKPVIGTMVEIPKSRKAQRCDDALIPLRKSKAVWAEVKYDGERAQVHVEVQSDSGHPRITIFSKSKRDSTWDRVAVHDIVYEALGLSERSPNSMIKKGIILDAEMVAFKGGTVQEFWRIRRLVESTAQGGRGTIKRPKPKEVAISQESMLSDDDDQDEEEPLALGLVFFDVLSLDSESLLFAPYSKRRNILESIIRCKPGRTQLAERFPIDMCAPDPEDALVAIFADQIADHQEGLVLKAEESRYNDYRLPWVKLKKDYIPGFGDSLDLVLVGASWEKKRARELRVGPDTYTTFYIGTFKDRFAVKPHLEIFYTVSFGLKRDELEELNFLIRTSETLPFPLPKGRKPENYTFSIFSGIEPPRVMLLDPLLVEVFGAGFTKSPGSLFYELRFPRLQKVHRRSERGWQLAVDLRRMHEIALGSVGRDRKYKETYDCVKRMWGVPCSPGAKCPEKRKEMARVWRGKLRLMNEVPDSDSGEGGKGDGASTSVEKRSCGDMLNIPTPEMASKRPRLTLSGTVIRSASTTLRIPTMSQPSAAVERPAQLVGLPPSPELWPLATVTNQVSCSFGTYTAPSCFPTPASSIRANGAHTPTSSFSPSSSQNDNPNEVGYRLGSQEADKQPPQEMTKKRASPFDDTRVWFMKNNATSTSGPCKNCSLARKEVSYDQRIHSLHSLLLACGWGPSPTPPQVNVCKAAIVVDCHDCEDIAGKIRELAEDIRSQSPAMDRRGILSIYTCNMFSPDELDTPFPMYVFQ